MLFFISGFYLTTACFKSPSFTIICGRGGVPWGETKNLENFFPTGNPLDIFLTDITDKKFFIWNI